MDRAKLLEQILEILSHYQGRSSHAALTESSSLAKELNIDSVRMVDVVLEIEEKFEVMIDFAQLTELTKVGDLVSLVEGLL